MENIYLQDDDIKSFTSRISPIAYSSLWNGMIQLNCSVKVLMSAFFKSGEKILDIIWPNTIKIKGRVKLEDFEKFVKDLRHSRNRSIMVISLCWNGRSSEDGLEGIKEVARSFEVNRRVGFAEIDTYIYVCPKSKAIIKILDKCGFWKGMSTVDINQDSLIGFVVWDRKQLVNVSTVESSIEKIQETRGTRVEAQDVIDEGGVPDSPSIVATTQLLQSSQVTSFKELSLKGSQQSHVHKTPSHEIPNPPLETPKTRQQDQPITDSHGRSSLVGDLSSHVHVAERSYKIGVDELPLQLRDVMGKAIHPDFAIEKNHIIGIFSNSMSQQKYVSSDEPPEWRQNRPSQLNLYSSHTLDDEVDPPELFFSPSHGAKVKSNVHPLNKETRRTGQFQQPSHPFFQVGENVGSTSAYMVLGNIKNPISHYDMEKECFRTKNGIDDQERMMRQSLGLDHQKLLKNGLSGLNSVDVEAERGLFPLHPPPVPEDQRYFHGHCPPLPYQELYPLYPPHVPTDQGYFHGHCPSLSYQGLYPLYTPRVLADQDLFCEHPPFVLADQGSYPPHSPPKLPYQGLYPQHPPLVPTDQDFDHQHNPLPLEDQGFHPPPPPSLAPGYYGSSGYHGNNNGTIPSQQHWMFGQCPQKKYSSTSSQHMRPPRGSTRGHVWRPMYHSRPENNHHGFERSCDIYGSSIDPYSGPINGLGCRPSSSSGHW